MSDKFFENIAGKGLNQAIESKRCSRDTKVALFAKIGTDYWCKEKNFLQMKK